ncbi:MAG: carboxylesterase/lipase family protein [Deltaproteobacteria bacterium]
MPTPRLPWSRLLAVGVLSVLTGCKVPPPYRLESPLPETTRLLREGRVVGGAGRAGSHAWLGIPFAAPPVGPLRWRAPRPAASWSGTREALTFGSSCPQYATPIGGDPDAPIGSLVGDEDCLTLSIWAPPHAPGAVPKGNDRLPVMVWIHGGGNSIGSERVYDGGALAAQNHVIVVAIQYRLGPLGFLRHRSLRAEATSPAEASGNFGLLDQIRALEWLQADIGTFGGDPANVTIFGESAGGEDVYALLLAPEAKGLFARAIVESGGLSWTTPAEAESFQDGSPQGHHNSSNEVLARLLLRTGQAKDHAQAERAIAKASDPELARLFRAQSPTELFSLYDTRHELGMIAMPLVFDDGALLPVAPWTDAFAQGRWNRVPVLLGTNHDEAKLFLFFDPRLVKRYFGIVPRVRDWPRYEAASELFTRAWRAMAVDGPADAISRGGWADVYGYRFDWHGEPTIAGSALSRMLGAAHGLEIPFVFDRFDLGAQSHLLFSSGTEASRQELSRQIRSYWTELATRGAPGRGQQGNLPLWPARTTAAPRALVLDVPSAGGLRMTERVETGAKVIADLLADPRLPTAEEKCALLRGLSGWTHAIDRADYPTVGGGLCAKLPWRDEEPDAVR